MDMRLAAGNPAFSPVKAGSRPILVSGAENRRASLASPRFRETMRGAFPTTPNHVQKTSLHQSRTRCCFVDSTDQKADGREPL
jgi:hypothetical protein